MLRIEPVQPVSQKIQDQEKISGDQNRIDHQLNCKRAQIFGLVFFHEDGVEGLNIVALGDIESFSLVKVGYHAPSACAVNSFDVRTDTRRKDVTVASQ